MDHLTQEVNLFPRALFQRLVTDLDGIFYAITKAEMPGQHKLDWAKIEHRGRKILFAQIRDPTRFLDFARDRRTVINWYIKLFNGDFFIEVAKLRIVLGSWLIGIKRRRTVDKKDHLVESQNFKNSQNHQDLRTKNQRNYFFGINI